MFCTVQWHHHNWQSHGKDHQARALLHACTWLRCHGRQCKFIPYPAFFIVITVLVFYLIVLLIYADMVLIVVLVWEICCFTDIFITSLMQNCLKDQVLDQCFSTFLLQRNPTQVWRSLAEPQAMIHASIKRRTRGWSYRVSTDSFL